jgi:hypothetical protein
VNPKSLARVASSFEGLERLSTQTLMDILEVCHSANAQPAPTVTLPPFNRLPRGNDVMCVAINQQRHITGSEPAFGAQRTWPELLLAGPGSD